MFDASLASTLVSAGTREKGSARCLGTFWAGVWGAGEGERLRFVVGFFVGAGVSREEEEVEKEVEVVVTEALVMAEDLGLETGSRVALESVDVLRGSLDGFDFLVSGFFDLGAGGGAASLLDELEDEDGEEAGRVFFAVDNSGSLSEADVESEEDEPVDAFFFFCPLTGAVVTTLIGGLVASDFLDFDSFFGGDSSSSEEDILDPGKGTALGGGEEGLVRPVRCFRLLTTGFGEGDLAVKASFSSSASLSDFDEELEEKAVLFVFLDASIDGTASFISTSELLSLLLLSLVPLVLVSFPFEATLTLSNFCSFLAFLTLFVAAPFSSSLLVISSGLLPSLSLYHSL